MPRFIIERNIPNAGRMSPAELQTVAQKSCDVLRTMGPEIQWVQSYVTNDQVICVYYAADEAMVRKHAQLGGFPADKVSRVETIIDPTTAETAHATL